MAVSREQLIFDAFANTSRAESNFQSLGRKAGAASDDVMGLARRLDEISKKSAAARFRLEGDKEALARLDKLDLKMVTVGHRVMDPKVTIEGAARAAVELAALDVEFDKVGQSAEKAAGDAGKSGIGALVGGGGFPGGGIGALVAAGAALSPVLVTLGFGLAGFGAAAAGVAAPIAKAAQKTGGLQAHLDELNAEQQKVAKGLIGLGGQFSVFEKSLQPQVMGVFNQGLKLAGHLLHDVQPVAKATGTALGVMLSQIDAEFQSGTWQDFFGFMARTAGPDVALLSQTFINLTAALPPLMRLLQPVATDILAVSAAVSKLVAAGATAGTGLDKTAQHENFLAKTTDMLRTVLFAPGVGLYHALKLIGVVGGDAGTGLSDAGHAAVVAGPPFFDLNRDVGKLNTSMTTLAGNLLTLQGNNVAWRQSMQAAKKQLDSNTAGLAGNSKNALANKQAIIQSTQAAIQFAGQQLTLGKDIGSASRTIEGQIHFLQGLHDKSAFVRGELKALRAEEALLNKQRINQTINVQGLGHWQVSQSLAPGAGHRRAKGGRVPGYGGGDRWPALLEGGEAIVPKHLTPMVAPFLRAHKVPGFASGGLIPTHSGLPGMVPWIKTDDAATIRLIDQAVVKATVAGMRAAQSAAAAQSFSAAGSGGPASGAVRALQQYAASLFGQYGWSVAAQLPPLIALWNGESGWSPIARNQSSGAFGIPQALPPGKMGALAASGNAAAQIRWGESYIHGVYGTPANAYGIWLSRSPHWYGSGGSGIFTHPTVIGVGERGPERVDVTPVHAARASAGGMTITLEVRSGGSAFDAALAEIIRRYVRVRGGNVQQVLGRV